jgi:lactate permease
MLSLLALLKFWRPKNVWRFDHERTSERTDSATPSVAATPTRGESLRAWTPWALLTVFVFVWGLPQMKSALDGLSIVRVSVPYLDKAVIRVPPVVVKPEPEAAVFNFNWLSATGTSLLLAGIASGLVLRLSLKDLLSQYVRTILRVRTSLLTIAAMLALGYTTRYSGSDTSMGLAFASTGVLFPFFSPLLGWLGVALTGSDTSSNVLFGNLQTVSARQIGVPPLLTAAANASGGVMGKMIDAQSIVVASVATGDAAAPGAILRYVFFHSLALACLVGVLVLLQAYVFTWMVPV